MLFLTECSSIAACLNDGQCVEGDGLHFCNCPYGFNGSFCETGTPTSHVVHVLTIRFIHVH
ncbi:MAG: calcium-binding EGF-like domain-containing protein [Gammaproteobacteria bacterium]|nr:calcium-binding EGF-like domain-containing protein [Gammaproteobacteria bacterium]